MNASLLWIALLFSSFPLFAEPAHMRQALQISRPHYRTDPKCIYEGLASLMHQTHSVQETALLNGFNYIERLYGSHIDLTQYVKTSTVIGILTVLLAILLFLQYRSIKRQKHLRMQAEAEIQKLAHNDVLTGLYNRHHFFILASHAIKLAARENTRTAVLFIDLNDFKVVNTRFGRKVGDQVLAHVGYTLSKFVRSSDITARIGGEEFAVLLNNISNIEDVLHTREKIAHEISRFIVFQDKRVQVTASIGIGIYPDDGTDIDKLLEVADARICKTKLDNR